MLYFTLVAKSSSSDTLYCVNKPTKNSDGLYTVTPKEYKTLDGKITIPVSGLNGFIVPEVSSDDSGWNLNTTSYTVKETMSYDSIKSFSGISNNEIKAIKGMMSIFDYNSVYYFDNSAQVLAQGRLFLKHHNKGQWSCTKTVYLDNGKQTVKAGSVTINQDNIAIQSDKVIAQGGTYKNSLAYNQRGGSIYGPDLYKISKTEYVFTLTFETLLLAPANQWELGSIAGGANTWPGSYCFYCNDPFEGLHDHIKYFLGDANLSIQSSDKDKLHKPTAHGGSSSSSSSASYNDTTSSTVYNGYTNNSSYSSDSLKKVSRLEYGKTGVYQDGVATVPYVMMELRDSLEATTGYNLSIPANTFVSLTHERNLSDSYNTFSLQLFDKDAMQVEAKILLGWRYIAFYSTFSS